jgi:hypothetical protein
MDISKCSGKDCPLKENCYRFTVKSDDLHQSYFTEPPIKDGKCEMYWGDTSQRIFEQLKKILNNKNK